MIANSPAVWLRLIWEDGKMANLSLASRRCSKASICDRLPLTCTRGGTDWLSSAGIAKSSGRSYIAAVSLSKNGIGEKRGTPPNFKRSLSMGFASCTSLSIELGLPEVANRGRSLPDPGSLLSFTASSVSCSNIASMLSIFPAERPMS